MKSNLILALLTLISVTFTNCATVDSGHKGVEVSWGGETNMTTVYGEGMDGGMHWLVDDMVEYDVREKTMVKRFEFNDKNNMGTGVEISVDYNLNPDKVNLLHTKISDVETKIIKTLKSAGKEVIPQYSAVELNISKRTEAESKLAAIMAEELPEFYVEFARIQMTDVDIPDAVAKLAEETAVQLGRNELAEKKEAEKTALAKAKVAEAKGNFEAAQYDDKTKALMTKPAYLELERIKTEQMWAKKGVSPWGSNNFFGVESAAVMVK